MAGKHKLCVGWEAKVQVLKWLGSQNHRLKPFWLFQFLKVRICCGYEGLEAEPTKVYEEVQLQLNQFSWPCRVESRLN